MLNKLKRKIKELSVTLKYKSNEINNLKSQLGIYDNNTCEKLETVESIDTDRYYRMKSERREEHKDPAFKSHAAAKGSSSEMNSKPTGRSIKPK